MLNSLMLGKKMAGRPLRNIIDALHFCEFPIEST